MVLRVQTLVWVTSSYVKRCASSRNRFHGSAWPQTCGSARKGGGHSASGLRNVGTQEWSVLNYFPWLSLSLSHTVTRSASTYSLAYFWINWRTSSNLVNGALRLSKDFSVLHYQWQHGYHAYYHKAVLTSNSNNDSSSLSSVLRNMDARR
jgi:hypothetical protein